MKDEKDIEEINSFNAPQPESPTSSLKDSSLIPHPSSFTLKGRPTWAEINLDNLTHNFRVMKEAVGPEVAIMPAVKADAYGHGAIECAEALEQTGADWFGVALPEEGLKLREAGITRPIL